MRPTSASPITSADAVTAVRRGFRMALARASDPLMPSTRSGHPTAPASGPSHGGEEHHDPDEHPERAERDDLHLVEHAGDVLGPHEPVDQDPAAHRGDGQTRR